MKRVDPFSPESRDPFYVPDRTGELASFVSAGAMGTLIPVSLLLVPLRPLNLALILAFGVIALLTLLRGMEERRHRLSRTNQVNELRNRLFNRECDSDKTQRGTVEAP